MSRDDSKELNKWKRIALNGWLFSSILILANIVIIHYQIFQEPITNFNLSFIVTIFLTPYLVLYWRIKNPDEKEAMIFMLKKLYYGPKKTWLIFSLVIFGMFAIIKIINAILFEIMKLLPL